MSLLTKQFAANNKHHIEPFSHFVLFNQAAEFIWSVNNYYQVWWTTCWWRSSIPLWIIQNKYSEHEWWMCVCVCEMAQIKLYCKKKNGIKLQYEWIFVLFMIYYVLCDRVKEAGPFIRHHLIITRGSYVMRWVNKWIVNTTIIRSIAEAAHNYLAKEQNNAFQRNPFFSRAEHLSKIKLDTR